jgi:hypothetical protein
MKGSSPSYALVGLVLLIGVGIIAAYIALTDFIQDVSSKAFVDDAVPAIVNTWSASALLARATPQLRRMTKVETVVQQFAQWSLRLGPLVKYEGSTGDSMQVITLRRRFVTARYSAYGRFSGGRARIDIMLQLDSSSHWSVSSFQVLYPPFTQ